MKPLAYIFLVSILAQHAGAAPSVLPNGLLVSGRVDVVGGPVVTDGETNATRPWVESKMYGASSVWSSVTGDRYAKITEPRLAAFAVFTGGWVEVSAGTWTNSAGWQLVNSKVTNDLLIWSDTSVPVLYSPPLTSGVSSIRLVHMSQGVAIGAQLGPAITNMTELITIWGATNSAFDYVSGTDTQLVFSPVFGQGIPEQVSTVSIERVEVWGWSAPENVGETNDFRAQQLQVAEAVTDDSPLNLRQFSNLVWAIIANYERSNWSVTPASNDVALAGHALWFNDSFFGQAALGSTSLVFGFNNESLIEMHSAQTIAVTPILGASHYGIMRATNGLSLLVSWANGYRPIVQRYDEVSAWTNMPDGTFTNESAGRGRQTVVLYPVADFGMFRVVLTNMSQPSVTGIVNVTAPRFLHLGRKVLTEADYGDIFSNSPPITTELIITNAGGITFSGTNTSGGLKLMPLAPTNGTSKPIKFYASDGTGTVWEAELFVQSDGRVRLTMLGQTAELYSDRHSSFVSQTTFQNWNTNVLKIGYSQYHQPGWSEPLGSASNIRWITTNLVMWNREMARWLWIGSGTTNYNWALPTPP